MKKTLLIGTKVILSVGLIYWLIQRVDWGSVFALLSVMSLPLLFIHIILQLLGNTVSAKKWQTIASYKELPLTLKEAFFTYIAGTFINNFLPSTLGGDAYRGLWLAKKTGARAASFSTVVFDRFIGLWTTALVALLFSPFLFPFIRESVPLAVTYICLVIFFVVDLIITYVYCKQWFHRFVAGLPVFKLRRFLEEIIFYTKKHIWLYTSLWSALFILVGLVLSNYVLFRALGSDVSFLPFASVMFLVAIVSSIPLTINNIGIKEWTFITFFSLIGVSVETAVTVALLQRFIQMMLSFIALPQYLASREKKQ